MSSISCHADMRVHASNLLKEFKQCRGLENQNRHFGDIFYYNYRRTTYVGIVVVTLRGTSACY